MARNYKRDRRGRFARVAGTKVSRNQRRANRVLAVGAIGGTLATGNPIIGVGAGLAGYGVVRASRRRR